MGKPELEQRRIAFTPQQANEGTTVAKVIYVDTPGAIRTDFANIPYEVFKAPYWPRDAWS